MDLQPLIELSKVSLHYNTGYLAVKSVNLSIAPLEKVAFVGETGSGKTTLLRAMAGLEAPLEGEVRFNGLKLEGPHEKLIPGHEEIGYLSQQFELPKFTGVEKILADLYLISREEAEQIYEVCNIKHLLKRDTGSLSGGEKQRVHLARILTRFPRLVLLDEPFSNLDAMNKEIIKSVINEAIKDLRTTFVLVSHDPRDTLSWADKVVVMKEGAIVQSGSPRQLYDTPQDPYVAGLFGRFNSLEPKKWSIPGTITTMDNGYVMMRPERFKLASHRKDGEVKGTVRKKAYYGSYEELEVELENEMIIARSAIGEYKEEDQVYISLIY